METRTTVQLTTKFTQGCFLTSYVLRCPENTPSASVSSCDPLHDTWVGASDRLHGGDPKSGTNVSTAQAPTENIGSYLVLSASLTI